MFLVRPIRSQDYDWLCQLSKEVGVGFTSLPYDKEYLKARLSLSIDSFEDKNKVEERVYLLVIEDTDNNELAGLCGIVADVGYHSSFYNFKISLISQISESLGKFFEHQVITMVNDFQHASELISLFVSPKYRGSSIGKHLSYSRLMFIGLYPELFNEITIAELRGFIEKDGTSAFWEGLGRHFFDMDFDEADQLTNLKGKQFISDLMPRDPIYLKLLSESARKVIGEPHKDSAPAKKILENQGFNFKGYIDIFDGGPVVQSDTKNIKIVENIKLAKVKIANGEKSTGCLLAVKNNKFICTFAKVTINIENSSSEIIEIDNKIASKLLVKDGDDIYFVIMDF